MSFIGSLFGDKGSPGNVQADIQALIANASSAESVQQPFVEAILDVLETKVLGAGAPWTSTQYSEVSTIILGVCAAASQLPNLTYEQKAQVGQAVIVNELNQKGVYGPALLAPTMQAKALFCLLVHIGFAAVAAGVTVSAPTTMIADVEAEAVTLFAAPKA